MGNFLSKSNVWHQTKIKFEKKKINSARHLSILAIIFKQFNIYYIT